MNIFVLDYDQKTSAKMLCDKHVVKMPTETCQILCDVHHSQPKKRKDIPYKQYNIKNPAVIWANESLSNYMWLMRMLYYQTREYTVRYGKRHKTELVHEWLRDNKPLIKDIGLTPFPLIMPDKYKTNDTVESYRNYYLGEKKHILNYTKRRKPIWM